MSKKVNKKVNKKILLYQSRDYWRISQGEIAIYQGDVDKLASLAFETFTHASAGEYESQNRCQDELTRLAKLGAKTETNQMREKAQQKRYDEYQKFLASCKLISVCQAKYLTMSGIKRRW